MLRSPSGRSRSAVAGLAIAAVLACAGCSRPRWDVAGVLPPTPLPPPPAAVEQPGLIALGAGDGELVAHWTGASSGLDLALFAADDLAAVYAGAPAATNLVGDRQRLTGFTNGADVYCGLAVRAPGGGYVPVGVVLTARPGAPVYVDAAASAAVADGLSPATAFPDLIAAVAVALGRGGANVWVRDGQYPVQTQLLTSGVHVYGGFGAGFDLGARRPGAGDTIATGQVGPAMFFVAGGTAAASPAVLDGFAVDGLGAVNVGVDTDGTPLELRSVTLSRCLDRGVRVRAGDDVAAHLIVAGCVVTGNGADGMSGSGALALRVFASDFSANVQEGLDLDDLVAPATGLAVLEVIASRFARNGAEGLDADLSAPPVPVPAGGGFAVAVRGARFEDNAGDGCLIDLEFEGVPGLRADVHVEGTVHRANGGDGLALDVDAAGSFFVHRVLATANRGDGVRLSSEIEPGLLLISSSVLAGNLGAGVRATVGNVAFAASHCLVAGNGDGGLRSDTVVSSAASTLFWLQPDASVGVESRAAFAGDDPNETVLAHAPLAYGVVGAVNGAVLTAATSFGAAAGDVLELSDDGVARAVLAASGSTVTLSSGPGGIAVPVAVARFDAGQGVEEDYRLAVGSPAAGAGMAVPGATPVDPGPFGGAAGGLAGSVDPLRPELLRLRTIDPPLSLGTPRGQPLNLTFSAALASPPVGSVRAVDAAGVELPLDLDVDGAELRATPRGGDWGDRPLTLEMHSSLSAAAGPSLTVPVALSVQPR